MRPLPLRAHLAAAALLATALAGCHFERNVADDCWIDQKAFTEAQAFRDGLRARNLPRGDGAWKTADARITRTRKDLQACQDGLPGSGRPSEANFSNGEEAGHGA